MTNSTWSRARRILCVRLDNMGDVLMCTPAIRAIKASLPDAQISLLTSGSGAAVASFIPEVDHVIKYAAPWMKSSRPHDPAMDVAMAARLREHRFDAAVIFTTYSQSPLPAAMLCYLAGIPLRLAHCRENPYQVLSDWVPETEPHEQVRHEVQRQLDLVATVGFAARDERLSFAVRELDQVWMRARLRSLGIGVADPWIMLHPGATAASRRYPIAHWAKVVAQINSRLKLPVVLTGDASEQPLIDVIIQAAGETARVHSLAGQLNLGQLGAAISLASVVLSNNTGPAHMAAAIGTPIVDLYALTNPQHTPWLVQSRVLYHDVPCRFCYKSVCPQGHHECLTKVQPEQVVEAAHALLRLDPRGDRIAAPILPAQPVSLPVAAALIGKAWNSDKVRMMAPVIGRVRKA